MEALETRKFACHLIMAAVNSEQLYYTTRSAPKTVSKISEIPEPNIYKPETC